MVLIVRGELRLTPGKAIAQAAHAAVDLARLAESRAPALAARWRATGQKKIALRAETLDEMILLERHARSLRILVAWIEDAGLTEVPAGTRTCLAIGPAPGTLLDQVTGQLDLY